MCSCYCFGRRLFQLPKIFKLFKLLMIFLPNQTLFIKKRLVKFLLYFLIIFNMLSGKNSVTLTKHRNMKALLILISLENPYCCMFFYDDVFFYIKIKFLFLSRNEKLSFLLEMQFFCRTRGAFVK